MKTTVLILIGLAIGTLLSSCDAAPDWGDQPDAGSADGDSDSDTDSDVDTDTICQGKTIPIADTLDRVMILQDVSGSMLGTKWIQAKAALTTMLHDAADAGVDVDFGLDTFPSDSLCGAGAPVLSDCGFQTATQLATSIAALPNPNGNTPLCTALKNFDIDLNPAYAPLCNASDANNYIILVSDGDDTCGGGNGCGLTTAFADVATDLRENGMRTYAIGFQLESSTQLEDIAQNGGTGATTYTYADGGVALANELTDIVAEIEAKCIYWLDHPSATVPDAGLPSDLDVFAVVGGVSTSVPEDVGCATGNGWRWLSDTQPKIELCNLLCAQVNAGAVDALVAGEGCP